MKGAWDEVPRGPTTHENLAAREAVTEAGRPKGTHLGYRPSSRRASKELGGPFCFLGLVLNALQSPEVYKSSPALHGGVLLGMEIGATLPPVHRDTRWLQAPRFAATRDERLLEVGTLTHCAPVTWGASWHSSTTAQKAKG